MSTAHDNPDSAEMTLPQDDLATRKKLGAYELKRKLGQGGMGAVYLAFDPALKRQVALKILPREKASNPQLVKRFKAEAQNASQLTHENIVSVYGAGEADGYLYIALEFVDGIDVHDLVERRGVLPVKRSIDIIKQVCRALQHALEQGIVHRDIKPANLLVRRDGIVKLADMGLARAVDETLETSLTRAGTTVGTVDYMSPEQARNSKAADVRSDMYSLGCTWYHMLTGTPPYSEGSLTNKLNAHANRPPPDARDKNPAVTEGVVAVMQRMMAKEPGERYQTPLELIRDLEGALVNRDAVSRKILEAIDDEATSLEEVDFQVSDAPSSEADSYPVNLQWSDSSVPSHPRAPTVVVDSPAQSSGSIPESEELRPVAPSVDEISSAAETPPPKAGAPKATGTTPQRGQAGQSPNTKSSTTPDSEPDSPTANRPAQSSPPAGTTKQQNSSKPAPAGRGKPPPATAKPAAATKSAPPAGRPAAPTLPPIKRTLNDVASDQSANGLSGQIKMVVTLLGIAAGLGAIVFLASLAQRLGDAAAPIAVAPQMEVSLPPPPVQAGANPAGAEVAASADGAKKGVLIERPDATDDAGAPGKSNSQVPGNKHSKNVPEWVDAGLPANSVITLMVRPGASVPAERQFGSLNEALKQIPIEGAKIVLSHNGPFDLTPAELTGNLVLIEAMSGIRPQIRLVADGEHRKLPWLDMTKGTLALDGVDIVGEAAAVPDADPWSWLRVTDGNLQIRRSSFTLLGKRSGPTIALKLTATVPEKPEDRPSSPRFLLDQSVIRGDGLQAVQLETPGFDAVVRDSLVIAGNAAAAAIRSAEKALPDVSRQLRLVTSTICSNRQILSLSAQGTTNPVPTELISLGSLFAASSDASHPMLLGLEDWPANTPVTETSGPYKNLRWSATASAALGFTALLQSSGSDTTTVSDWSAWKKLWKEDSPTIFSLLAWPTDLKTAVSATPLKAWSPKTLDALALAFPPASGTPGCPVSELRAPDFSVGATALVRPPRPRAPAPFAAKAVIPVDLVKTDLGKFIGGQDWADGTVFVASGAGQKYSLPINVGRHKWRIEFRQTEGPTLVVSPRGAARSGDNSAFITIQGGQLEIVHGSFTFDSKDTPSVTNWFLSADGGSFSLQNCRIVIPTSVANRNRGIINWSAGSATNKAQVDGEFTSYGCLTDTLLIGNNTLISADMSRRAMIFKNSALIARQHLLELNVGLNQGKDVAAFDAQNCTFICGGTQFAVKSQAASGPDLVQFRMFQYNCVFAALPHESHAKSAPLLMNYLGAVEAPRQIFWYEESCGYSPELKTYFASEATLPVTPLGSQDFGVSWTKLWGADHVQRPLHGTDGVLFEKSLGPNAVAVRPENLTFHNTAKARSWSETSGPIGARPQSLEPPPSPPRSAPGIKKAPTKTQPKIQF